MARGPFGLRSLHLRAPFAECVHLFGLYSLRSQTQSIYIFAPHFPKWSDLLRALAVRADLHTARSKIKCCAAGRGGPIQAPACSPAMDAKNRSNVYNSRQIDVMRLLVDKNANGYVTRTTPLLPYLKCTNNRMAAQRLRSFGDVTAQSTRQGYQLSRKEFAFGQTGKSKNWSARARARL